MIFPWRESLRTPSSLVVSANNFWRDSLSNCCVSTRCCIREKYTLREKQCNCGRSKGEGKKIVKNILLHAMQKMHADVCTQNRYGEKRQSACELADSDDARDEIDNELRDVHEERRYRVRSIVRFLAQTETRKKRPFYNIAA